MARLLHSAASVRVSTVLLCLIVAILPGRAWAQCLSNASSCTVCHEAQAMRPVLQGKPWHRDHAFGDLCVSCHGGDPLATTQAEAHVGLQQALADPARTCAGCHADDATTRADRYLAAAAQLTASAPSEPSAGPPVAAPKTGTKTGTTADWVFVALAGGLAVALFVVLRRGTPRAPGSLVAWLRAKTWNPYVAGALLGLVVAHSEVMCGRPIAVSGAFDKLAAYFGRAVFPSSQYYAHVMVPGITWQVWLVAGVIGGAFASSKLSGEARLRWLPDTQWVPRFGTSRVRRLLIAFFGAVLVQVGAGIAGGCTSGLAISGGAALAPAAFLFMAGMFAGGIPAAWLAYRKQGS